MRIQPRTVSSAGSAASSEQARQDRDAVRRILAGDQDAFRKAFGAHVRGLYRFVLARVDHDPDTTQEIVQSTLAKAVASLRSFRATGTLTSWLYAICRIEVAAHYRRKKRGERMESFDEGWRQGEPANPIEGPQAALERRETARRVHETLDRLPRNYGDILEWKYVDGLSVRRIAERLGTTPKAAESLLTRARRAFRQRFGRRQRSGSRSPIHE